MKTVFIFLVVIGAGVAGLYAIEQPTIILNPASPSTVYVNTSSLVIVSAQITDPSVLSQGVNLLQVDPFTLKGNRIIGTLHDDGRNGDAVAGDHIYSISFQPDTVSPQLLTYKVSAAFRGKLQRSVSLPVTVAVVPSGVSLPPDPGPAGTRTLAGVDLDGDGVRDDAQRWIAVNYFNSAKIRSGLTQYAKAVQTVLLSSSDPQQSYTSMLAVLRAQDCANYSESLVNNSDYSYKVLKGVLLNTYDRARAFYRADANSSGHMVGIAAIEQQCDISPQSLPN